MGTTADYKNTTALKKMLTVALWTSWCDRKNRIENMPVKWRQNVVLLVIDIVSTLLLYPKDYVVPEVIP